MILGHAELTCLTILYASGHMGTVEFVGCTLALAPYHHRIMYYQTEIEGGHEYTKKKVY
jgi:hypothetical protein